MSEPTASDLNVRLRRLEDTVAHLEQWATRAVPEIADLRERVRYHFGPTDSDDPTSKKRWHFCAHDVECDTDHHGTACPPPGTPPQYVRRMTASNGVKP